MDGGPSSTRRIGRRLAAARRFRGWSVDELSRRSGMTAKRIRRCESTGDLTCDELEALAAALRLPVDQFVGRCCVCGAEMNEDRLCE